MIRCSFGSTNINITDFSPFHIEMMTTQIARRAALLPLEIVELLPTSQYGSFKHLLENKHRAASLRLSDAADFGLKIVRNAKINLAKPHRLLLDLKNTFSGIPAILVGAGPSLEENLHLLPENAIIFAGGTALKKIPFTPHFGACVDKENLNLKFDFPVCMQCRAHPIDGEMIISPDSHFPLMGETFDGGWTVGNFMVAIAVYFGCNPIVCVGMDYCTRNGKKYAFEETKVEEQEDWKESVFWLKNIEKKHPEITFLNASNGLKYFTPCNLKAIRFEKRPIAQIVYEKISNLKTHTAEVDTSSMLATLWNIWEPVFARSGDFSEEEMRMHQDLFFQQVIASYD